MSKIIGTNSLKDIGNKGFLCFTESPITLLLDMFTIFEKYYDPMYAPYGIAVKKDYFFDLGGRPVIYGSKEDKNDLASSSEWRFEEYIPNVKDFSWLREWRLNEAELPLDQENFFIVTKTKKELQEITFEVVDIEFDGDVADGQYWGYAYGVTERVFKGISIEDIEELDKLSKAEIKKLLESQSLDDKDGMNLGSFVL